MSVNERELHTKDSVMAQTGAQDCIIHLHTKDCTETRFGLGRSQMAGNGTYVVIAGPANTNTHYVTTIEEHDVQRYEGASTLFEPCAPSVRS